MTERYTRGSTVRLFLDLVVAGLGSTGESPTIAILRKADGAWFQAIDDTWQLAIVNNPMVEQDATALPGRYYFDFDQSLDDLAGSSEYAIKLVNGGTPVSLEYRDIVFGPFAATTSPDLCSVTGTIFDSQGQPRANALVRAVLQPVFKNQPGGWAAESDKTVVTYTNELGDFDLPLIIGGIFRLEIDAVGYDRKVTIPNQASVVFTDL